MFLRASGRAEVAAVLQGLVIVGPEVRLRVVVLGHVGMWATISPRRSLLGHLVCPCLPLYCSTVDHILGRTFSKGRKFISTSNKVLGALSPHAELYVTLWGAIKLTWPVYSV